MPEVKPAILIVDDDGAFRTQLRWRIGQRYEVHEAEDRESAVAALRERPFPVILLDLHLTPGGNDRAGLEVLRLAARYAPHTRVILLTGEADPQIARETLRWGAWDFCPKPMDPEKLDWILERAFYLQELESTGPSQDTVLERFGALATANPVMARVLRAARELASTRLPLLILGRPGCGKTVLACEILRARLPEGADCLVLPPGELPDPAAFPEARGWVLEQVESLPRDGQRRLEELLDVPGAGKEDGVSRAGRILATARGDLLRLARRSRFHPDLARRLEMTRLEIPALPHRPEDLPLLTREILATWSRENEQTAPRLTPEAETVLRGMTANLEVGLLAALLERAAEAAHSGWIGADALLVHQGEKPETLRSRRAHLEAALLREALKHRAGNVSQAARDLGVSRPTLHDLLRKHELDPSRYRQS